MIFIIQMLVEQLNVHMYTFWIFHYLKAKIFLKHMNNRMSLFQEKALQNVEVLFLCLN